MSPAWTMKSLPRRNASASGRSSPWVSDMRPTRAIAKRPDILLCDEPTGALDSQTGVLVLEAIERIHAELGTTTVLITHNAVIAGMSDRVLVMGDGRIQEERRNAQRRPARELSW